MSDTEITFSSGDVTLHGSVRVPVSMRRGVVPGVLLLAGSGPTDRNGDSALLPGPIGTLRHLADVLERHGFASLRYDKLGSGVTGLGPYDVEDVADLGFSTFIDAASAGLDFLAGRRGVDANRLYVVGHSEGALIALALAQDNPRIRGIGLVEPLAVRLLDLLTAQIDAQLDAVVVAQKLPVQIADELRLALTGAVESLRADGTLSDHLPEPLRNAGLVPANAKALAEEDALDPRMLAAQVDGDLPVLSSASTKDIQVRIEDVDALDDALVHTRLTSLRMTRTNHVLKDIGDQQSTGADYIADLPFSEEFTSGFEAWLKSL
ncbi:MULTISPECIES: alpha/beta hydrolase [unclassified Rhodococcus (in: high G+C Gram-positive bacteria)]|uniref:alpha/beta hydrolase n=1 Tax=unclassified Rhodococcus (in: high G+C Gram-positive bacteria) TaxID=192944 RepID=UPI0019DB13BD|nr:alpha/beta hydrolase [Rhodococcus sp. (in: high G+C Gram-positive bacteria)]MBF0660880.1 alpha/beta fold hydrolase [Rhodococcus sp. (in: high G+C Gram-positive bacteria)]